MVRARVDERSETDCDVERIKEVAAQEGLEEEVDVDLAVAQHGELVVGPAFIPSIGPQSPVAPITRVAKGASPVRKPVAPSTSQISSVAPAIPTLLGKRFTCPKTATFPGGSGTTSEVAGSSPRKK